MAEGDAVSYYRCAMCGGRFGSLEDRSRHYRQAHPDRDRPTGRRPGFWARLWAELRGAADTEPDWHRHMDR